MIKTPLWVSSSIRIDYAGREAARQCAPACSMGRPDGTISRLRGRKSMEQGQAQHVSFFHLNSRIGRLRYFAYGITLTWVELPLSAFTVLAVLQHNLLKGLVLTLISYVVFLPIRCTFAIRRLHDIGWSGWWCLIMVPQGLLNLAKILHPTAIGPGLNLLSVFMLAIFGLVLLFTPGSQGENRYGREPPPNTGWVVFGAWSALLLFMLIIVAIVVWAFNYRSKMTTAQVTESI